MTISMRRHDMISTNDMKRIFNQIEEMLIEEL